MPWQLIRRLVTEKLASMVTERSDDAMIAEMWLLSGRALMLLLVGILTKSAQEAPWKTAYLV